MLVSDCVVMMWMEEWTRCSRSPAIGRLRAEGWKIPSCWLMGPRLVGRIT